MTPVTMASQAQAGETLQEPRDRAARIAPLWGWCWAALSFCGERMMQRETRWYRAEIEAAQRAELNLAAPEVELGQRERDWPASGESALDSDVLDTKSPTPVRERKRFSFVGQSDGVAPIADLLRRCCPPHIARHVVAFIVDAVDRMFRRWAPAYVRQERFEGIAPLGKHCDAAPAIEVVVRRVLVETARLDVYPRTPFRRSGHPVRVIGYHELRKSTSARAWRATTQAAVLSAIGLAAVASADRKGLSVVCWGRADNDESTTPISRINWYRWSAHI
jgi:hypothetical protein